MKIERCLLWSLALGLSLASSCGQSHSQPRSPGAGDDASQAGDSDPLAGDGVQASEHSLLITEILDGPLVGGTPKFVEISNVGRDAVDLSTYSMGVFVNGSRGLRSPFLDVTESRSITLSGILHPDESYVVNFENDDAAGSSSFFEVYGFDPDHYEFDAVFNGDDAIVLFFGPATEDGTDALTVDSYGSVGVDGSGQPWEYVDSHATRKTTVLAAPAAATSPPDFGFNSGEWNFFGADALDGVSAAQLPGNSSPGQWP